MQALTAGIVNLVPEGLILLISLTAAVSAFKVAQRGVLAQQLNAVESLASVDVVCTDKTGTLTEPTLRVVGLGARRRASTRRRWRAALATYAASAPSRNLTLQAIADAGLADVDGAPSRGAGAVLVAPALERARPRRRAPRAGSAGALRRRRPGARRAGAREAGDGPARARARPLRGAAAAPDPEPAFPDDVRALGLVVLAERLRPNAAETVAFFAEQDVELKVLSGDAPATVGAIARDAGVPGSAPALDGEALPSEPAALREAVLSAPAVGRISPDGKRAVVDALTGGRALRGDGRRRRQRRAGAQGGAARDRAGLGDADGALGRRPRARPRRLRRRAGHGRRGPADPAQHPARRAAVRDQVGVRRPSLALAVAIPTATFPLLPRQFTIASTVTIGIPAFVLALAPSSGPWRPERFLRSVARFAVPAGVAIGIGIVAGYLLARYGFDLGPEPLAHGRDRDRGRLRPRRRAPARGAGRRRRRLAVGALCARDGAAVRCSRWPSRSCATSTSSAKPTGDAVVAWAVGVGARHRRDARRTAPLPRLTSSVPQPGTASRTPGRRQAVFPFDHPAANLRT